MKFQIFVASLKFNKKSKMHVSSSSSSISSSSATDTQKLASQAAEEIVIVEETDLTEMRTETATFRSETKISFNLMAKKKTAQVVTQNKLASSGGAENDDDGEEDGDEQAGTNRKRGIIHLEDGIIVDTGAPGKKKEKKLFIIPVLHNSNQAQIERLSKLVDEGTASEQDKARLALLLESVGGRQAQGAASWTANGQKQGLELSMNAGAGAMPTLVVPDDAKPDYDSMPVGEFGLAFLRGCGWKDQDSLIGKSNAQAVPLRLSKPRPKGLGLGATLPSATPPDGTKKGEKEAVNGAGKQPEEEDQTKILAKDAFVRCLGGLHKGVYGQVVSMDEENSSIFLALTWPSSKAGRTARVSQFAVEVITTAQYRAKLKEEGGGGGMKEEEEWKSERSSRKGVTATANGTRSSRRGN